MIVYLFHASSCVLMRVEYTIAASRAAAARHKTLGGGGEEDGGPCGGTQLTGRSNRPHHPLVRAVYVLPHATVTRRRGYEDVEVGDADVEARERTRVALEETRDGRVALDGRKAHVANRDVGAQRWTSRRRGQLGVLLAVLVDADGVLRESRDVEMLEEDTVYRAALRVLELDVRAERGAVGDAAPAQKKKGQRARVGRGFSLCVFRSVCV